MTGIVFDIKKFAIHDGPGIRTTVFLKGCQLDCQWCHNPESRKTEPEIININQNRNNGKPALIKAETFGYESSVTDVINEVVKDKIFYDESNGGVTFSGGEPMVQIDFLEALLKESKSNGISTCVDTTGYASFEQFEQIYDLTDLFLYDLKLMDDEAHKKYTGVSNKLILENLIKLSGRGSKVWVRIPMIPGITDTDENLQAVMEFIKPLKNISRVSLLPYNILGEDKRDKFQIDQPLSSMKTQSKEFLNNKSLRFRDNGFEVKIGG